MASSRADISILIGSSSESKEVAEYLQVALDDHFETTVWDQGIFSLSNTAFADLMKATNTFDFAILIYAADDVTRKRNLEKAAPRDNVIFESGLFMGALGAERTFMVFCADDDLHIPSDLHGVTMAPFHRRKDGNLRAAINPVAVKIREAVKKVGARDSGLPKPGRSGLPTNRGAVLKHVSGLVRDLTHGFAGITLKNTNSTAIKKWLRNVLGMAWDTFASRQKDVYVAWLRPSRKANELGIYMHRNLAATASRSHYRFLIGEGLAGMVWKEGESAATSQMRQHKWWVFREGCENMSYVCACVGEAGGPGGILAVGSDLGFELSDGDEESLQAFATLLEVGAKALGELGGSRRESSSKLKKRR